MDAVPLEMASASTTLASSVHKTRSRRMRGSEVAQLQQLQSVSVGRGKGGSLKKSSGGGDVRSGPALIRRKVQSGSRVTVAGRRGPAGGMVS